MNSQGIFMPSTITDRASGFGTGATPNGENATISQKVPCRVATTANIALAGLQTLDTVTVVADDRVLVKDQTDASENGIYLASSDSWQRTSDCVDAGDLVNGSQVRVNEGNIGASSYYCTSADPIIIGTDDIAWVDVATTVLTGAEIKALYEGEVNTNAYTDAEQAKVGHITVSQAIDLDQMETDIAALSDGMVYKGNWDASSGIFPGAGAAQTGWFFYVSVAGTVDGIDFAVGDNVVATTENASTSIYLENWSKHDQTPTLVDDVDFDTKPALEAADIAPSINLVRIAGYTSVGDGGGASYRRVVSEPSHAGKIQTIDTTWWELAETLPTPQMFGAVADGLTNATTAIQAAIDYAESLVLAFTRGATVLFPPGGYFVSATLTINSPQITLQGYGQSSMFIRTADYGNFLTIVSSNPDTTKIIGVQLRDFYVLCKTNAVTTGALIHVTRASRMYISNVSLQDGFIGIHLNGCDNLWMSDIDVQSGQRYLALSPGSALVKMDPWDDGLAVRTQNASIYMNNVQLKTDIGEAYIDVGLLVTGVDGLYISNSHIGFAKYAIQLSPFDDVANIQHIFVHGTYIDGNVEQSDFLLFVTDAVSSPPHTGLLKDITFVDCGFIRPRLKGIVFVAATSEKFTFSACDFDGGNEDAIQINPSSALSNSVFSGCIFDNWNRDAVGGAWEVRFLSGNTSDNVSFSHCQFLSASVNENVAFAGSENDIRFDNCKFSKTSFGGTVSGKNIRNHNASGITSGLSENYGTASISPNGSGQGTITHGLTETPTFALADVRGDSVNEAEIVGYGATAITVRIHNAAGADVTAGTFNVHWIAKV